MKIASFLITAAAGVGFGVVLFFFLLVALNGFSESQATPGLIFFFVWVLMSSLLAGVLSLLLTSRLMRKNPAKSFLKAILSVFIFSLVAAGLEFVGLAAAIILVSALS